MKMAVFRKILYDASNRIQCLVVFQQRFTQRILLWKELLRTLFRDDHGVGVFQRSGWISLNKRNCKYAEQIIVSIHYAPLHSVFDLTFELERTQISQAGGGLNFRKIA